MDNLEDIIDFVNDKLKIDYRFLYSDYYMKHYLDTIFSDLNMDKYYLYKETNWYYFLYIIVYYGNCNCYCEFDDDYINYFLGVMYHYGYYVEQNDKKAFEYFKKASKKGNYNATYQLGNMYSCGYHGKRDYRKANICYKRSIKQSCSVFDIMDKLNESNKELNFYLNIMDKLDIQTINFQIYEVFPIYIREKVIEKLLDDPIIEKLLDDPIDIFYIILEKLLYIPIDIFYKFEHSYIKDVMTIFYNARKEKLYYESDSDSDSDSDIMVKNIISTKQKNLLNVLKGKNNRLSKYISLLIFNFIY